MPTYNLIQSKNNMYKMKQNKLHIQIIYSIIHKPKLHKQTNLLS